MEERPDPKPGPGQVRIRVAACGVCRTDLHLIDGELPKPKFPIIPGHEIVGRVDAARCRCRHLASGSARRNPLAGRKPVSIAATACAAARTCATSHSSPATPAMAVTRPPVVADARFSSCHWRGYGAAMPSLAPLLCAGLIGWRALRHLAGGGPSPSAAAALAPRGHMLAQVARLEGRRDFALTRPGDARQALARRLGAEWAGGSERGRRPRTRRGHHFRAGWRVGPQLAAAVGPGGRVVCTEIHMSDIPAFSLPALGESACSASVANLTRADGRGAAGARG